jgi:hypothetical protein
MFPDFMPNIAFSSQNLQVEHTKRNVWFEIRGEKFPSTSNCFGHPDLQTYMGTCLPDFMPNIASSNQIL